MCHANTLSNKRVYACEWSIPHQLEHDHQPAPSETMLSCTHQLGATQARALEAYPAITAGACPSAAVRAFQSMPLLSIGCDDRVSQIAVTKGRRQPTSRVSSAVLGRHTVVNETYAISSLDSRANDGLKAETGSSQGASEHGMRPAGKSGQLQRNYVL